MIPRAHITAWRTQVPWPSDAQVEQDLIISRALVEMYTRPPIAQSLAFRGGTALHKLHFHPPRRYSEDLDFVQIEAGPIGPALEAVREALDPWLGDPAWRQSSDSVKLLYRFETTTLPVQRMRVKIEINTREHFTCRGLRPVTFSVDTLWLTASAPVTSYEIEELLGTKLRALYQRKKGRDLYDLAAALAVLDVDAAGIVECFRHYMASEGAAVTRRCSRPTSPRSWRPRCSAAMYFQCCAPATRTMSMSRVPLSATTSSHVYRARLGEEGRQLRHGERR